ncbi:hypothetical protein GF413_06555 [Candidatus Micrarchaeota archaeon]|nr:hypothetical protein [Candidatus Micrarchaeota archaeon]
MEIESMNSKHISIPIAAILSILFQFACIASCDAAPHVVLGRGAITPLFSNKEISLSFLKVDIKLQTTKYIVSCVLHLNNPGNGTKLIVGFPLWYASQNKTYSKFVRNKIHINGQRITFEETSRPMRSGNFLPCVDYLGGLYFGPRYFIREMRWYASYATFPGGQKTIITDDFELPYVSKDCFELYFLYGFSGLWSKKVERIIFTIDCSNIGGSANISTHFDTFKTGESPPETNSLNTLRMKTYKDLISFEIYDLSTSPADHLRISKP